MTTTDQIIDGICKDLAKQQDMEMYVNISDVRRTLENHLAGKLVLDRKEYREQDPLTFDDKKAIRDSFTIIDNRQHQGCAHDNCPYCKGTGQKLDGSGLCVHNLYCNCPKCSPIC